MRKIALGALTRGRAVTQVDAPVAGEVLAGRYRLDRLVSADAAMSHLLWQGTDNLLNRTVAIELRVPGGPVADAMISAAVAVGQIIHPGVVGVYDAVNEGERAFVVREWVEGRSLRDAVRDVPLDPTKAAAIARDCADALASIHAAGFTHGNVHPGTVLLGTDDDITLIELRLDPNSTPQADVRALGGVLYASLTGHWPHELPSYDGELPDAMRADGRLLSPRQVRAGIPGYLDALTMDLLDPAVPAPSAAELAAELHRYDITDPTLGPLSVFEPEPVARRPIWKRIGVPLIGLVCILVAAFIVGTIGLPGVGDNDYPSSDDPTRKSPSASAEASASPITPAGVTIMDPPPGDQTELEGAALTIDGDAETGWRTDRYQTDGKFGLLKSGMGVVVDLGEAKPVSKVTVQLNAPGATVELRVGDESPGRDPAIYTSTGAPKVKAPQTVEFTIENPGSHRYLMLWITELPPDGGGFAIGVQEIKVFG